MGMPSEEKHQDTSSKTSESSINGDITPSKRRYSSEEVAEIIRLSLQNQEGDKENTVDHDELLAIANEVGVNRDDVDRAIALLEDEQLEKDKADYLWSRFRTHSILFISVNLLCIIINVMTNTTVFWSMYMLFGWGLFLLGHYAGLRYAPQFVELAMQRTSSLANARYQEFLDYDSNVGFTVFDPMGLTETQGLINLEGDNVVVEYQTLDSMMGFLKTSVKHVEIAVENLTGARLEQKLWSSYLVLQGRNIRTFKNAPGSSSGRLRVRINRQSRKATESLVQEIRARLTA